MSEVIKEIPIARTKLTKGESMFECEATAEMLLMPRAIRSPEKTDEPIEVALVRAVLAGEHDRYGRLYEMYAPLVHGILLARVPRDEVADLEIGRAHV